MSDLAVSGTRDGATGDVAVDTVAAYRAQGFVHVPGVLTRAEVDEFLAAARDQLADSEKQRWDDEAGNVMEWIADPELKSEPMRRLALHPRVTTIAEQLAGRPLRMFKTELLRKRGGDSAHTPLHIDALAFPFHGAPVTLTAWVALVDVPVERGCLGFLPGSQLLVERAALAEVGWDLEASLPELAWRPRVLVPVRAGDVTFHHEQTVHLAGANLSDADRISLTTVYMDAEATFAPERIGLSLSGDSAGGGSASDSSAGGGSASDGSASDGDSSDGDSSDLSGLGPEVMMRMRPGQPMDGERFPRVGSARPV